MFSNFSFENRAVCVIIWKNNSAESDGSQMTIWHMGIGCWMPKVKKDTLRICNTYCFSTKQWLREQPECYIISTSTLPVLFHLLTHAPLHSRCCLVPLFNPVFVSSSLSLFLSHPSLFLLHLFALSMAVTWLRRLVFGLWPRRVGFDPRPVRVGFVGRVAVW
jgi:hypothetical protein